MIDLPDIDTQRELWHGVWTVLAFALALLCVRYIFCKRQRYPIEWRSFAGVQLAIGMLLFMAASVLRAGPEWALIWHENRGHNLDKWQPLRLALLFAGPVVLVGGGSIARVLTREVWSHWAWIVVVAAAAITPIVVHFL